MAKKVSFDSDYVARVEPALTDAEARVIRYIHMRNGSKTVKITLDELLNGRKKKDIGTQLEQSNLVTAIMALKESGFLEVKQTDVTHEWHFKINWDAILLTKIKTVDVPVPENKKREFLPCRFFLDKLKEFFPNEKFSYEPLEFAVLKRQCRKIGEGPFQEMAEEYISTFVSRNWKQNKPSPRHMLWAASYKVKPSNNMSRTNREGNFAQEPLLH